MVDEMILIFWATTNIWKLWHSKFFFIVDTKRLSHTLWLVKCQSSYFFWIKKLLAVASFSAYKPKCYILEFRKKKKRIKEGQYGGINYIATRASTPLKLLSFTLKNLVLLSQSVHDFNWRFFSKWAAKFHLAVPM
jgi:hypothetical protein